MKKVSMLLALLLAMVLAFSAVAMATESEDAEPEQEHEHVWDYVARVCADCGEAHPCWNEEEQTYVHDFTDSEVCLVCGADLYCGVEDHEKNEDHMIASCGVPGHFVCDEANHDVYRFDPDGHTQCLEEQTHSCEECGADYTCEHSNSHVRCKKCGKLWCNKTKGDHKEAPCGHRYCEIYGESKKHEKCPGCGKYLCNGKSHSKCTASAPSKDPEEKPAEDEIVPAE